MDFIVLQRTTPGMKPGVGGSKLSGSEPHKAIIPTARSLTSPSPAPFEPCAGSPENSAWRPKYSRRTLMASRRCLTALTTCATRPGEPENVTPHSGAVIGGWQRGTSSSIDATAKSLPDNGAAGQESKKKSLCPDSFSVSDYLHSPNFP